MMTPKDYLSEKELTKVTGGGDILCGDKEDECPQKKSWPEKSKCSDGCAFRNGDYCYLYQANIPAHYMHLEDQ